VVEFEIAGQNYRAEKLDAMKQWHISRKIAPLIPAMLPAFLAIKDLNNLEEDLPALATVLQPLAEGLASMSDESSEYLIATCLSVVQRQVGNTWGRVWDAPTKTTTFTDIDMGVMMKIVIQVIQDSLGSFIAGLSINQQSAQE
jgi:hypothetical protein